MRFVVIPTVAFLLLSSAAGAQEWDVYSNRDNFFSVNLPGQPTMTQVPYKTTKGTNLTARVFTAVAPAGSILSGTYTVTVVDYSNAKDEFPTADEVCTSCKTSSSFLIRSVWPSRMPTTRGP